MTLKKLTVLLLANFLTTSCLFAQDFPPTPTGPGDSLSKPVGERIAKEAKTPYYKRVHRVIDTRQKKNMVVNYPKSRLFDIIHKAAMAGPNTDGGIPVYTTDSLGYGSAIPKDSVMMLGASCFNMQICKQWDGDECIDLKDTIICSPITAESVKKFRIMEDWVFDNEHGDFRPHIIAIAPLFEQQTSIGSLAERPLYWVKMSDLNPIIATKPLFNTGNDMQELTYFDFFQRRLFESYVVGETNVYDADFRYMEEYEDDPIEQLLQGERVEEELFNREHDFWEY